MNCSQTGKNSKNHPVYEDESGARRKVAIVRGTLMWNFMIRIILGKCCVYYITVDQPWTLQKTLLKYLRKMVKNRFIIAIIYMTSQYFRFKI